MSGDDPTTELLTLNSTTPGQVTFVTPALNVTMSLYCPLTVSTIISLVLQENCWPVISSETQPTVPESLPLVSSTLKIQTPARGLPLKAASGDSGLNEP